MTSTKKGKGSQFFFWRGGGGEGESVDIHTYEQQIYFFIKSQVS